MTQEKPFGIKLFGVAHIIIGIVAILIISVPFFLGVIVGWVSDDSRDFENLWGFFWNMVVFRTALVFSFISAISLLWSGIGLLRMRNYSRKLTIVSAIGINSILIFFSINDLFFRKEGMIYDNRFFFIPILALLYLFFLIGYLTLPTIKNQFSDERVRFNFLLVAVITIILLFSPFLFVRIISLFNRI